MANNYYYEIYDQPTKDRWLASIDLNQYPPRWWERAFEKTCVFEKMYNKDFHSFTVPDILGFYKFLDVGTLTPLLTYNENFAKYAQWALNEHLIADNFNHFTEIDNDQLYSCLSKDKMSQSILSYDKFNELINIHIINDQDKFVFYCLFEGIKGKDYLDICNMKMEDVDEHELVVHLADRDVKVNKRFVEIAKAANAQTTYETLSESNKEVPLLPGATIIKEKYNSRGANISRQIYSTIVRNIDYISQLSEVVTAKSIRDSGLIYYFNKRADQLNMSVKNMLYDNPQACMDIVDKYQFNLNAKNRWLLQFQDFIH